MALPRHANTAGKVLIVLHAAAFLGLPFYFIYHPPSLGLIIASAVMLILTEIGIGAGYHRFYSHVAYRMTKGAEAVFLFLATVAMQGPALKWSSDHRMHHAHVDTDGDPYNVMKGFWHAHIWWIFENPRTINEKFVPDLLKNPLVMFQYRHINKLAIISNVAVCLLFAGLLGDFLGAIVMIWGVRLLVSYHLTWFINSLAHYWGEQSYSKELSARDNAILAILTVGEGYHNYHHTFPADYRNGMRKFHFDPVKWTVWTLSKLGLAYSLRTFNDETVRNRLIRLDKALLLQRLEKIEHQSESFRQLLARRAADKKAVIERQIHTLADSLNTKREAMKLLLQQKRALYQSRTPAERRQAIKAQLKAAQKSYAQDWKDWCELCTAILKTKISPEAITIRAH